jgi:dUTP pyrophosphatase
VIKAKKLHQDAKIPTRGNPTDAGLDIHTLESALIPAGQRALLRTGIALSIPVGQVGLVWPRSKLAAKKGLAVLAGVIDSGYRGEVMVSLLNTSDSPVEIKKGDKCAQMVVQFCDLLPVREVETLDETRRGSHGINDTEMRY